MPEPLENLTETVEKLTEQVMRLAELVETPDSGVVDRVIAIEEAVEEALTGDNSLGDIAAPPEHPPDTKVDFVPERKVFGGDVIPFEIEFGKPTANVTTDVDTVTMQPCDEDGTSFASADEVTVYVANDRQTQDTDSRGWTTSTILSFYRFSPFVSGTPNIEGVLIGEPLLQYTDIEDVEGIVSSEVGITFDEWFDVQGNKDWFTVDARDWSNRFVEVAALWDAGVPSDSGSWNEDNGGIGGSNVQHYESLFGGAQDQEEWKWFRLYLKGGGVAQLITKIDTDVGGASTTMAEWRMATDGTIEMRTTQYNIRTSMRITVRAFKKRDAADAIVVV